MYTQKLDNSNLNSERMAHDGAAIYSMNKVHGVHVSVVGTRAPVGEGLLTEGRSAASGKGGGEGGM